MVEIQVGEATSSSNINYCSLNLGFIENADVMNQVLITYSF